MRRVSKKQAEVSEDKVTEALDSCQTVINNLDLTISELILLYGNLGYHIGAAVAGIVAKKGPDIQVLKQRYYSKPAVDLGLMLQGLLITSWEKDFADNPLISSIRDDYQQSEEQEKTDDKH